MSKSITVGQIVDRFEKNGLPGKLLAGTAEMPVEGIATTYNPSIDVLRKAVETGRNLVVSRRDPYWTYDPTILTTNRTFVYKRDFIARNRLVLLQLGDAPSRESPDYYLQGLAEALGWEQYHLA